MDITTHEIRSANWKTIIQNCQSRPAGTTVKQWLDENGISEKSYYYWQRKFRKQAYQIVTKGPSSEPAPTDLTFAEIPLYRTAAPGETARPGVVIQKGRLRIELNDSVSDELLVRILETVSHA